MQLIEPSHPAIPITRQCELLDISRSTVYYEPALVKPETVALMNTIDEIYTAHPYYGSPKITAQLRRDGKTVNHKAVERLMRVMGIAGIAPRKNTSVPNSEHRIFPYLLKGITATYPNHIWGTDITYVRANGIWFYLVAILDWYSRYILAWRLSKSMSVEFCTQAITDALVIAIPDIHNSDQGSQFTSDEYIALLQDNPTIQISMDGRGRCFDNIFTERFWRTVKYEEVYLHDYQSYTEAVDCLRRYFVTYNTTRLHQALNYQTPAEVYFSGDELKKQRSTIAYTRSLGPEMTFGSSHIQNFSKVEIPSMN